MIDGLGTGFSNVKLANRSLVAEIDEAIHGDVSLTRSMDESSTMTMTLSDPQGSIRRSSFLTEATRMTVDGLKFALMGVSKTGQDLELTVEDDVIHRLRQLKGPKKAYRDQVTRAQFSKSLVREAGADIRFYCPELNVVQPIAKGKEAGTTTSRQVDANREMGIPRDATGLTVKDAAATRTQKRIADEVIREAQKFNPPRRALVALLCAVTHESVMGTLGMTPDTITDGTSVGILQALTSNIAVRDAMSIPYNVRRFMVEPWTGTPFGGAIEQANDDRSIGEICTSIQGNSTGDVYTQWKDEAEAWIEAFTGGGDLGSSETTVTTVKRYAFKVGKSENYWQALLRLAEEVGWRCFVVGKTVYFIAETILMKSRRRMKIGDVRTTEGIDDVDWDINANKVANAATVYGRIKSWKAPPGTVVELDETHGPAEGRWLVASIDGFLNKTDITVELKRPSKPKPEPAAETSSKTIPGNESQGGGGTAGAEKAVDWAKKVLGVTAGSSKHQMWMTTMGRTGGELNEAWCSDWIAYLMQEVMGFNLSNVSAIFPDSICWASWDKANQVSIDNIKPGDIVMYSGAHVGLYIGGGRCISGNYSSAVTEHGLHDHPSPVSNIARPPYE